MFRSFLKSDSLANIHRIDEAREVSAVDRTPHNPQEAGSWQMKVFFSGFLDPQNV